MSSRGEEVPREAGHITLNLPAILAYVGIDIERGEHNALEDAKLTAEAIARLAHNKPLLEEYEQYPIPWQ